MSKLMCRISGENSATEVADTQLDAQVRRPMALVEIRRSCDTGARGGVVITIRNPDVDFVPWAVVLPDGVEVHIAGEAEAQAILAALREALG